MTHRNPQDDTRQEQSRRRAETRATIMEKVHRLTYRGGDSNDWFDAFDVLMDAGSPSGREQP